MQLFVFIHILNEHPTLKQKNSTAHQPFNQYSLLNVYKFYNTSVNNVDHQGLDYFNVCIYVNTNSETWLTLQACTCMHISYTCNALILIEYFC